MNEAVKWTDILQGIGSIAGAVISIVGFVLLWRQIKLTNETLKQNNHTSIYTINTDIYKYLADNSHLRPYFYENKELEDEDPNTQQLLGFCEIIADFFEFILIEEDALDHNLIEPWEFYMQKIYKNSPVFRKYIEENEEQYTKALYTVLISSIEKPEGKRNKKIPISDRNKPIAKIVPLHNTAEFSTEELALAAAGILRLPEESEISEAFLKEKRPALKSETAIKAVIDERDED